MGRLFSRKRGEISVEVANIIRETADGGSVCGPTPAQEADEAVARRERERRIAVEQSKVQAEEILRTHIADDESQRIAALDYIPPVSVVKYPSGLWLRAERGEEPALDIPLVGISEIQIAALQFRESVGPFITRTHTGSWGESGNYVACPAELRRINIITHSGATYSIACNRHVVNILYPALVNAWKYGRTPDESDT